MSHTDIFLKDNLGQVTHVVMTKERYEALTGSTTVDDVEGINLPYAKNYKIPLTKIIEYFISNNIEVMPINNKACVLSEFKAEHLKTTLDPVIRLYMLEADSPYRNTMQAVNEVVEQLVNTKIFELIQVEGKDFGFKRRVKALKIDKDKARQYLSESNYKD